MLRTYFRSTALLFGLFTLCKLVFFLWTKDKTHGEFLDVIPSLFFGIRFDAPPVGLLLLLAFIPTFLLPQQIRAKWLHWILWIGGCFFVSTQLGDLAYFLNSGVHISYEVNNTLDDPLSFIGFFLYTYPFISCVSVFICIGTWITIKRLTHSKEVIEYRLRDLFIILVISFLCLRGGPQGYPLEPDEIFETDDQIKSTLGYNATFVVLYSKLYKSQEGAKKILVHKSFLDLESSAPQQEHYFQRSLPSEKDFKDYNVVFMLLERWTARLMKPYGGKEITPFFDSLQAKSFSTKGFIAGGKRTSEAFFNMLCSFPNPLGQTIPRTQLTQYKYRCLPSMLKERGYETAVFQGSVASMGAVGGFAQRLGIEKSYDRSDVSGLHPTNGFGYYDKHMLEMVNQKISELKEPFLAIVNTNTTHENVLPPYHNNGVSGKGVTFSEVMTSSDTDLKEFFENYQKLDLKKPTLWIMFGDHTGFDLGVFKDKISEFMIPLLIHGPDIQPKRRDIVTHMRDVAPTILDALGIPSPEWFTGQSMFAKNYDSFADFYLGGVFTALNSQHMVYMRPSGSNLSCFNATNTPLLDFKSSACSQAHKNLAKRAARYNHSSQEHLFSGTIESYVH